MVETRFIMHSRSTYEPKSRSRSITTAITLSLLFSLFKLKTFRPVSEGQRIVRIRIYSNLDIDLDLDNLDLDLEILIFKN